MFLMQLGVMALDRAGLASIPEDEAVWCAALRHLTRDFPDDAPASGRRYAAQPGFM
ncbi:hypothetical protein [Paracoccus aminovorans]|uniref:hypothetical protein n=1 Tax=Paracoccus aminovorans TaxID=34004 RepID=UPI000A92D2B7|nr:hypothetical protein [Paracoccus aminovorans]MDQ7774416.1 hypothetical protein [Paracoccus aminovorans]